jgi:flagellar motility protein MotE (MotC chaperone)
MKHLIISVIMTLSVFNTYAEDKKYTEKEFNEKVQKEVEKKINLVKKKSLTQFANELLEKEQDLQDKEDGIKQQEEQLRISEKSLLKKIEEFEVTKTKIIGCIDTNKKNEQMRIKQLVSMISGMKPLKAAEVLSVQQSDISVKILGRIDPQKASKIFNLMDKEVSARLQKQYLNMQQ